jgi:hypothetical protein
MRLTAPMRAVTLLAIATTFGCSPAPGAPGFDCRIQPGFASRFAITKLVLPTERTQFAADLMGDGVLHNQLGLIISALEAQNADAQSVVDQAIASGAQQIVIDVQSRDRAQQNAAGAGVGIAEASGGQPGEFCGNLNRGAFTAAPIAHGVPPVEMTLTLAFLGNLRVPLTAAVTQLQVSADGKSISGQVNGAVRAAEIMPLFAAPLAAWLTQRLSQEPVGGGIHNIFDTGGNDDPQNPSGCLNLDGTPACRNQFGPDSGQCARARDGIISTCEVSTNSIIKNIGAPDVRLFAADGSYCPGCTNTKDGLSFGVGVSGELSP